MLTKPEGVKLFLRNLNLEQYYEMFVAKGFDLDSDIFHLTSDDLDAMYIAEERHRKQILEAVPQFTPSREFLLYDWLRDKGLDHYFIGFVQSDLIDLSSISRLNLPDEELYDELEITLPGHKRRLEKAVRQLAKKHRMAIPTFSPSRQSEESTSKESEDTSTDKMEIPVAYGRWGKPRCLLEAKYDFLILDATVASTLDPLDRVQIEFMIDSGSDVVTLRQEVLDSLDLELIGPITSKGVHASRTKNLYRANMIIGNHTLEIEVMGETYDSIGSRVIRHFRHYITGNRHIWLKGDFVDPTIKTSEIGHVGEGHPVSAEGGSSPGPQEISSVPAQTTSSTQGLPGVSTEKAGGEPEEELFIESEQTTEEEMESTEPTKVQKDSGVMNGHVKQEIKTTASGSMEKIEFSFKTADVNIPKDEERSDETDLLVFKDDDVIDVRPFIEANRAKHAKDFQQQTFEKYKETRIKINAEVLENGSLDESNILSSVGNSDNDDIFEEVCNSSSVQKMSSNSTETFLSTRSVYYRSQSS